MSKIFILGVSHTRSFINESVIPIYLGPGSDINLLNGYEKLNNKIDIFITKKMNNENDIVLLQIGEESVRFLFRNELYPHIINNKEWGKVYKNDIKRFNSDVGKEKIDTIIKKYIQLIEKYKKQIPNLLILSAITSFAPINDSLCYFNNKIESIYGDKLYINIFATILDNIDHYLDFNFKQSNKNPVYKHHDFDPIHLNTNCCTLLLNTLSKTIKDNIVTCNNVGLKKCDKFKCYML